MSSQPMYPIPPVVPGEVARELAEGEREDEHTDTDGTPVGDADRDEDIRRSGGDPEDAE